jgi:two-component system cell cycle sensor histidine kinase/response regulator CckA
MSADERRIDEVTASAPDMTAKQNAEEALRRSEEQFRTIFDSMGDGVAISEPGGNFLEVNRVLCGRLGYSREQLLTMPVSAINSPESAATVQGRVDEIMRGGGIRSIEATHVRRDGTELPIEAVSRRIAFRGRPAILTVYRDITERKQADEALTASVARLKIAMDAMLDGVSILSAVRDDSGHIVDFRIDYANAAIGVISRVAAEEQVGHTLLELFPAHRANGLLEAFVRVVDTGVPFTSADFRYADPNAEGGPLDQILDQRVARLGDGCILSVRDVTERRALREQLTQAQKMEAIGRLAGGVAHDFNNLLTAIRGFAELHLAEHAADDAGRADVVEIERAAERATQLTMRLLAFSRRAEVHPTPVDLAGLVRDAMALLRRLVGEDIVVHLDASPTVALVFADPVQMEQVLLNLAANARDAMPTGGTLGLEIKSVLLGDAYLATHPGAKKGWQVLLAVSDTGVGMDEATRAHIFEPFFTTKPLGEGTGLGLASVYGIVKQAGGYVDVESLPGGGSVFRVYLPVLEGATAQPLLKPAAGQARRDGTETILLVEDESAVRLFAKRVLEDHGYRVLAFGDPGFALDAVVGDQNGFDALVTDVVMPTMSGPTLAERIAVLRPGLPVLFMSAYGGGVIPPGAPTPLAKPFTGRDLADAVGALFGRAPSGGGSVEASRS